MIWNLDMEHASESERLCLKSLKDLILSNAASIGGAPGEARH